LRASLAKTDKATFFNFGVNLSFDPGERRKAHAAVMGSPLVLVIKELDSA